MCLSCGLLIQEEVRPRSQAVCFNSLGTRLEEVWLRSRVDDEGGTVGGAQLIMMAGPKRGSARPKKGLFRFPLIFGGPILLSIAMGFFLWWIQTDNRENER